MNHNFQGVKFKEDGFTLTELVVALGLFSMVMIALSSAFLMTFRSQRVAFAFLHVQNNVRHVLEVMSREMRTGRDFAIFSSPHRIQFTNDRGDTVQYCLVGRAIRRHVDTGVCNANTLTMTAGNVEVTRLRFILEGTSLVDGLQPRITVISQFRPFGAHAAEIMPVDLQTTVIQREIDG